MNQNHIERKLEQYKSSLKAIRTFRREDFGSDVEYLDRKKWENNWKRNLERYIKNIESLPQPRVFHCGNAVDEYYKKSEEYEKSMKDMMEYCLDVFSKEDPECQCQLLGSLHEIGNTLGKLEEAKRKFLEKLQVYKYGYINK